MTLVSAVEQGLPLPALDRLVHLVAPGDIVFTHRLVARATLARRRKAALAARQDAVARLSREEGGAGRAGRRNLGGGRDVWGTDDEARRFLFTPHPSVVARMERNLLINDGHPEIGRIKHEPIWWDRRLFAA